VLDTILSIQPKDSGGGGETREEVVYKLAEEFLGKLPRNYVDFEVDSTTPTAYWVHPEIFLKFYAQGDMTSQLCGHNTIAILWDNTSYCV